MIYQGQKIHASVAFGAASYTPKAGFRGKSDLPSIQDKIGESTRKPSLWFPQWLSLMLASIWAWLCFAFASKPNQTHHHTQWKGFIAQGLSGLDGASNFEIELDVFDLSVAPELVKSLQNTKDKPLQNTLEKPLQNALSERGPLQALKRLTFISSLRECPQK